MPTGEIVAGMPGADVLDERFVDVQLDAHRRGIGQADDGLPLANDGAFLHDEVVAAQVLRGRGRR